MSCESFSSKEEWDGFNEIDHPLLHILNPEPCVASNWTSCEQDGAVKLRISPDDDDENDNDDAKATPPLTLHSVMAQSCLKNPNHVLVQSSPAYATSPSPAKEHASSPNTSGSPQTLSLAAFYSLTCRTARALIHAGVSPNHAVTMMGTNHVAWMAGWWAAVWVGATACGNYPTNRPQLTEYILRHSRSQALVIESASMLKPLLLHLTRDNLPELKLIVVYMDESISDVRAKLESENGAALDTQIPPIYTWEQFLRLPEQFDSSGAAESGNIGGSVGDRTRLIESLQQKLKLRLEALRPNRACCVIYTSGTTGQPKGALISHDNLTWQTRKLGERENIRQDCEAAVSYLPLSHILGVVIDLMGSVMFRIRLTLAPPNALRTPGALQHTLTRVQPTIFIGVPRVFEKIVEGIERHVAAQIQSAWWWRRLALAGANYVGRTALTRVHQMSEAIAATAAGGEGNHAAASTPSESSSWWSSFRNPARPWFYSLADALLFQRVRHSVGLSRARIVLSSGAPLSPVCAQQVAQWLGIVVPEYYGLTEATGGFVGGRADRLRDGSCGWTTQGVRLSIHRTSRGIRQGEKKEGEEKQAKEEAEADDEEGELLVAGRNVFLGYLDNEDHTRNVFLAQETENERSGRDEAPRLRTGDLARIDRRSGGFVYITGRLKELIVTSGGENVAPVPLEEAIKQNCAFASNVLVIGDKRKFLACLITIKCVMCATTQTPTDELDPDVIAWCRKVGLNFTANGEVIPSVVASSPSASEASSPVWSVAQFYKFRDSDAVRNEVARALQAANSAVAVSNAARVQKWCVLPRDFSLAGGELGPTLKVKRHVVTQQYAQLIQEIYEVAD